MNQGLLPQRSDRDSRELERRLLMDSEDLMARINFSNTPLAMKDRDKTLIYQLETVSDSERRQEIKAKLSERGKQDPRLGRSLCRHGIDLLLRIPLLGGSRRPTLQQEAWLSYLREQEMTLQALHESFDKADQTSEKLRVVCVVDALLRHSKIQLNDVASFFNSALNSNIDVTLLALNSLTNITSELRPIQGMRRSGELCADLLALRETLAGLLRNPHPVIVTEAIRIGIRLGIRANILYDGLWKNRDLNPFETTRLIVNIARHGLSGESVPKRCVNFIRAGQKSTDKPLNSISHWAFFHVTGYARSALLGLFKNLSLSAEEPNRRYPRRRRDSLKNQIHDHIGEIIREFDITTPQWLKALLKKHEGILKEDLRFLRHDLLRSGRRRRRRPGSSEQEIE
jgi:hypothetical protein